MVDLVKRLGGLIAGAALMATCGAASAENFPTKPVHILVPYAAGGAVDVLARTLGQSLAKIWGQQPIIDNRPGAGGIVASQALVQSAPDGYTLILVASGHPLNQFIYPKLPYDTFKDFTAISEIASSPLAILVSKKSPYTNLQDILAASRKDPDSLSYGMSGNGTSAHLAGELLKYMADVKIVAVPYKGGAPALTAVIAGDIPTASIRSRKWSARSTAVSCARLQSLRRKRRRSCPTFQPWRRQVSPVTTFRSGGDSSDPPACHPRS
jgi:tripartite-type tricarboxylate transporter receptor subunit TctC